MALDIHAYDGKRRGDLLFQIDDRLYGALHPAFELFRQRTGKVIDPYDDLVLDSELPALIAAIRDAGGHSALLDILLDSEQSQTPVIFVGD